MSYTEYKWDWMMDYCKSHRIPPAQGWAWSLAEMAWNEFVMGTSR